jgi:4-oxalocrotonate tautomerase
MPFVRVDLVRGKSAQYRKTVGEIFNRVMLDIINVPLNDKFQVITEHSVEEINISDEYLGNRYSEDIILIQITLTQGRSVDLKKAFFKRVVDGLNTELGVRRDDVVITL